MLAGRPINPLYPSAVVRFPPADRFHPVRTPAHSWRWRCPFRPSADSVAPTGRDNSHFRIGLDSALIALIGKFTFTKRIVHASHLHKYIQVMRIIRQRTVVPRQRPVQESIALGGVPRGVGTKKIAQAAGDLKVAVVKLPGLSIVFFRGLPIEPAPVALGQPQANIRRITLAQPRGQQQDHARQRRRHRQFVQPLQ